jgi:hypothetical protein
MTSPAPVRSNRELLSSARGGTIFSGVLTAAFLSGVLYQHLSASAEPVDVTLAALADRAAVPDASVVRVPVEVRPDTVVETTRGHALIALVGVPDVIVFCDAVQAECSGDGPAKRTLVGVLQSATEDYDDGVIAKFARGTLRLERDQVRVLNLRGDAGARGAGVRRIVFVVLASVFALFTLMGLARLRILGERVRREEAGQKA